MKTSLAAIAAAVALAVTVPASASVTHPLVTDPQGDAPAAHIDLLSGDINADSTSFTVTMELDDLPVTVGPVDNAPGRGASYIVELPYADGWFDFSLLRHDDGSLTAQTEFHWTHGPPKFDIVGASWSLDPATDTVSFDIPYSAANAVLTAIGQPSIGLGSTIDEAFFQTGNNVLGPPVVAGGWGSDSAHAGAYNLGD